MGLALILIGILVWLLLSPLIGLILVVLGVVILFVPGTPFGYGYYRDRRRGPR